MSGKPSVFEFGSFRLDPSDRLLLRNGSSVPLTPKAFELLLVLVERRGHVVAKDDLMKLVWSGTFVEETNLTHHISVLRDALGEDGGPFIETVPRRGYRFVPAVTERFEARPDDTDIKVPNGKPRLLWVAGLAALCAVVGFFLWRTEAARDRGSAGLRAVPLTSYPGLELYPTFSPDGSQVAFSWLKPGEVTTDIYVQQVGGAAPLRLTNDPAHDWSPSWSPDGKWIAFVRWSDAGPTTLQVTPSLPGTSLKVADLSLRFVRGRMFSGSSVAWSPDSKWIAVTDSPGPGAPGVSLILVSFETGERRRLTHGPFEGNVAFSPDSRSLIFTRGEVRGTRDVFIIRFSSDMRALGPATRLTSMRRYVGSPVWTADGREILFLSGENSKGGQLWRLRVPETGAGPAQPQLEPAPVESSYSMSIRHLRDGSARLAYMRYIYDPDISALDLIDSSTPAQGPRTLIASTLEDFNPHFSPDGRSIVFESLRSGTPEIWKSDRDGLNAVQLTALKSPTEASPRWSPDGRWIAFNWGPEGNSVIYAIASEGGDPKRLTHDPASDMFPSWSRDGRWIYFASNRSGNRQVWKMKFEPDSLGSPPLPVQVTKGGGQKGLESVDGKVLFYTKGTEPRDSLWSIPSGGGEERQVVESVGMEGFVPASGGIYFMAPTVRGKPGIIQFLNFSTGKISTVFGLEKPLSTGLSLSPDGRTLLFSQVTREESDLMMVDNWRP